MVSVIKMDANVDDYTREMLEYLTLAKILTELRARIAKSDRIGDAIAVLTTTNHVIVYTCDHFFVAKASEIAELLEEVSKICRDEFDKTIQLLRNVLPDEYSKMLDGVLVLLG
jgi:hypothetical protein